MFAQALPSTDQFIQGFGLPAGIVILVLLGVVVYQQRKLDSKDKRYDDLQEKRLAETKETAIKLTEPLEEQRTISQKMYDILVNLRDKREP